MRQHTVGFITIISAHCRQRMDQWPTPSSARAPYILSIEVVMGDRYHTPGLGFLASPQIQVGSCKGNALL